MTAKKIKSAADYYFQIFLLLLAASVVLAVVFGTVSPEAKGADPEAKALAGLAMGITVLLAVIAGIASVISFLGSRK